MTVTVISCQQPMYITQVTQYSGSLV